MQAVLVMFRSDGDRRSFSITRDMTVIGRREDCDLRIPLNEVSRKHARIVRDGDELRLEDLGSSNGTFLNGQRVQESVISPGDSVQIGPVIFVLQVDGYPADGELQPIVADTASQELSAPAPDEGPLSPTAQSEIPEPTDVLEALPGMDGDEELEELPSLEEDMGLTPHTPAPPKATRAPAAKTPSSPQKVARPVAEPVPLDEPMSLDEEPLQELGSEQELEPLATQGSEHELEVLPDLDGEPLDLAEEPTPPTKAAKTPAPPMAKPAPAKPAAPAEHHDAALSSDDSDLEILSLLGEENPADGNEHPHPHS